MCTGGANKPLVGIAALRALAHPPAIETEPNRSHDLTKARGSRVAP
jgi:hypothetical protein